MGIILEPRKCRALSEGLHVKGCKGTFTPERRDAQFCNESCRWTYHNERRREKQRTTTPEE